jgi:hypothetical protein
MTYVGLWTSQFSNESERITLQPQKHHEVKTLKPTGAGVVVVLDSDCNFPHGIINLNSSL